MVRDVVAVTCYKSIRCFGAFGCVCGCSDTAPRDPSICLGSDALVSVLCTVASGPATCQSGGCRRAFSLPVVSGCARLALSLHGGTGKRACRVHLSLPRSRAERRSRGRGVRAALRGKHGFLVLRVPRKPRSPECARCDCRTDSCEEETLANWGMCRGWK